MWMGFVLRCLEVWIGICFEVSRGSDSICHPEVCRGSLPFDIWRCLAGVCVEVSRGSDGICYHEVSRGSVSFDIWRCLEVWLGLLF